MAHGTTGARYSYCACTVNNSTSHEAVDLVINNSRAFGPSFKIWNLNLDFLRKTGEALSSFGKKDDDYR
jgi:hypothetical protein